MEPKPLEGRASAATTAFQIVIASTLGFAAFEVALLFTVVSGETLAEVDLALLKRIEGAQLPFFLVGLVAAIATMVTLLRWQHRGQKNLHLSGLPDVKYSGGWAGGSWFVPLVNLFVPWMAIVELWRGSVQLAHPADEDWKERRPDPAIGTWIRLFWIGRMVDGAATRLSETTTTQGELIAAYGWAIVASAFTVASAVYAIRVIGRITSAQTLWLRGLHGTPATAVSERSSRSLFLAGGLGVILPGALALGLFFLENRPDLPAEPLVVVTAPRGEPSGPLPAMVWLHGYGAQPDIEDDYYQAVADALGIAVIGVAATHQFKGVPSEEWTPDVGFEWSEIPTSDAARIGEGLNLAEREVPIDRSRVGLFGFSQGAAVAGVVAAGFPERYRGAILLSPGSLSDIPFEVPTPLVNRRFFITVNAGEHRGNLDKARSMAEALSGRDAAVTHRVVPDVSDHSFPPDFARRFIEWSTAILDLDVDAEATADRLLGPPL